MLKRELMTEKKSAIGMKTFWKKTPANVIINS